MKVNSNTVLLVAAGAAAGVAGYLWYQQIAAQRAMSQIQPETGPTMDGGVNWNGTVIYPDENGIYNLPIGGGYTPDPYGSAAYQDWRSGERDPFSATY
jgi:hypothetical protein